MSATITTSAPAEQAAKLHDAKPSFFGIVRGEKPDRFNWLTSVPVASKQPVGV